jgi:hypothetical protein
MLRILFLIALTVFFFACLAQENDSLFVIEEVPQNKMEEFLDSLKSRIVKDTSRFKRVDLIFPSIGALNKNPYSPLFIVNKKYEYKLDIIPGQKVKEFVDEILVSNKIEKIILLNEKSGYAIYGELGKKGAVLIDLKKSRGTNFYVAGFKMHKDVKLGGNNFEL